MILAHAPSLSAESCDKAYAREQQPVLANRIRQTIFYNNHQNPVSKAFSRTSFSSQGVAGRAGVPKGGRLSNSRATIQSRSARVRLAARRECGRSVAAKRAGIRVSSHRKSNSDPPGTPWMSDAARPGPAASVLNCTCCTCALLPGPTPVSESVPASACACVVTTRWKPARALPAGECAAVPALASLPVPALPVPVSAVQLMPSVTFALTPAPASGPVPPLRTYHEITHIRYDLAA